MNIHPVTFNANMHIAEAVERLLQTHQMGGAVIDDKNHVIGFLSEKDCLIKMLEATYLNEPHYIVGDIMHKEPLTAKPEGSVLDLAQLMSGDKPKMYPVIDETEKLIGIITREDVLKAMDVQLKAMYQKGHTRMV